MAGPARIGLAAESIGQRRTMRGAGRLPLVVLALGFGVPGKARAGSD